MENYQVFCCSYFLVCYLKFLLSKSTDKEFPFLKDPKNVLSVKKVTFLHDNTPSFKALQTQKLLRNNVIDFFSSSEFPGSSPDLNACENISSILKGPVEELTVKYDSIPSLTNLR